MKAREMWLILKVDSPENKSGEVPDIDNLLNGRALPRICLP
jgi:hypothetical protein